MKNDNNMCFCGSQRKQKKCHGNIHPESVVANLYRVYVALDHEIALNHSSICHGECHDCCKGYFYISEIEFFAIVEYMRRNFTPSDFANYIDLFSNQLIELQTSYPNEYEKLVNVVSGTTLKQSPNLMDDTSIASFQTCAFVSDNGKCSIYPVRPLVCRIFGCYKSTMQGCTHQINNSNSSQLLLDKTEVDLKTNIDVFNLGNQKIFRRCYPLVFLFANTYVRHHEHPVFIKKYQYSIGATIQEYGNLIRQINKL